MQYLSWAWCSTKDKEKEVSGFQANPLFYNMKDLSRTEMEKLIDEWIIGRNAERNRKILKRRLLDGICYEPLAEEFDMSVKQVQRIVYKTKDQLFRHIEG